MAGANSSKDEVLLILQSIIKYCDEEKARGSYAFPVDQVVNRVVAMSGKSRSTIIRIRNKLYNNKPRKKLSRTIIQKITPTEKPQQPNTDDTDR